MIKIGVVTATRAEYGLLKPLMKKIEQDSECKLVLFVTGTHLIPEYGSTINYIKEDGFQNLKKIYVDIRTENSKEVSLTMGRYFKEFATVFEENKIDILVVLGDRYELIPICFCAVNAKIPIAHISGGEVTAGAIDDAIRHSVTKLSYLHFPACETYRKRIIQLGENPERVFNVGDPGVENIYSNDFIEENEIREKLNIPQNKDYFIVIFHPTTLEEISPIKQVEEVIKAIEKFEDIFFIVMKSNADLGGQEINERLFRYVKEKNNVVLFSSLKTNEYLSLQKYSCGMIGNSSSGIVETPCFGLPTINIGDRQKGRLMADSIINVSIEAKQIESAIKESRKSAFKIKAKKTINPYGKGETSSSILKIIKEHIKSRNIDIKKVFYDLEV